MKLPEKSLKRIAVLVGARKEQKGVFGDARKNTALKETAKWLQVQVCD